MANFEIAPSVSAAKIARYFADCRDAGQQIHTLEIAREGALLVRASCAPYDCADVRENHSLSKSVTSLAIGMLIDDGLLSLHDSVASYFPGCLPASPDPRLSRITVRNLLQMASGHMADTMPQVAFSENPAQAFFAQPLEEEPGTRFCYNTGATCVLGELVRVVSGMPLFDFVQKRLFLPLGITDAVWNNTVGGACEAGTGLQLSCDDILKLGLFLCDGGVCAGKRLLSASYLAEATAAQSATANIWDNIDSACGYGYQFWCNSAGGYRADGSLGQFCFVFPETRTVVALQSYSPDVQAMMDPLYAMLPTLTDGDQAPAAPPAMPCPVCDDFPLAAARYTLAANPYGFTALEIVPLVDEMALRFTGAAGVQTLNVGCGYYAESTVTAPYFKPKLITVMRGDIAEPALVSACCEPMDGGARLTLLHRSAPMPETWELAVGDGSITVTRTDTAYVHPEARVLCGIRDGE